MPATTVRRALFVALLLSVFAASASAQFDTASVVGTVRDSSGGVVPGADRHPDQHRNGRVR